LKKIFLFGIYMKQLKMLYNIAYGSTAKTDS